MLRLLIYTLFFSLTLPLTAQPFGFLNWSVAEGLPQSQASALAEDTDGYLWVGTRGGGVARFDGATFRVYTIADGLGDNFVNKITTDDEGNVFVETNTGTALLKPGAEVFVAADQKLTAPTIANPENDTLRDVTAFLPIPGGRSLVGTRNNGLYLLDSKATILKQYTEADGLPQNAIRALLTDRQGRHWIATSGGGISRMIPTGMSHYDLNDGLLGERIYALCEGKNGRLWVGASRQGMQYYDSTGFHRPTVKDPTKGVKITSIVQDEAGDTYFATDGRGIVVLSDSGRVDRITRQEDLPEDWIMRLLPEKEAGKVWAVSYRDAVASIERIDSTFQLTTFTLPDGAAESKFSDAIPHPAGGLLMGTQEGKVLHWNPTSEKLVTYGAANDLPAGPVKALALRRNTQLWVAVAGYGLYFTDLRQVNPTFFPLPPLFRDLSTNIFQLTAAPDRPELWIGTERGVSRLYLNKDGLPDYLRHYGRSEGFLGGETTAASLIDAQENIWFGTMNGLVRYEDDTPGDYLEPPPTFLESINLFYKPLDTADYRLENGVPHFSASNNHLNFRFRAIDLTYPERIRYRWRLGGGEGDWSPPSDESSVRYAGLPSGRYDFAVAATTDGGKTWGEPVEYTFVIESPLWRSTWFLGLVSLLGAIFLIGGFYAFYRRVQTREAAKRKQLEARNEVLELERKALQLQMNPHFIFNALNGIRGLVDGHHDAEARDQISRFAGLMRGILNNSRQASIPLTDEIKTLEDYLRMEQFCQPFSFTFTIHPPGEEDPEEISLPPMLLQPFVENAVLHGLSGKETGGHIDVRFIMRGRRMQCLVEDNGIGRQAAAALRKSRAPGHKSVALEVTRARVEAMKGKLSISDRPEGGTVVDLTIPVETW